MAQYEVSFKINTTANALTLRRMLSDNRTPVEAQITEVQVTKQNSADATLEELDPKLVRPKVYYEESYRIQIPGLPEGTSVPVYEPRVDEVLLAKILKENGYSTTDSTLKF